MVARLPHSHTAAGPSRPQMPITANRAACARMAWLARWDDVAWLRRVQNALGRIARAPPRRRTRPRHAAARCAPQSLQHHHRPVPQASGWEYTSSSAGTSASKGHAGPDSSVPSCRAALCVGQSPVVAARAGCARRMLCCTIVYCGAGHGRPCRKIVCRAATCAAASQPARE